MFKHWPCLIYLYPGRGFPCYFFLESCLYSIRSQAYLMYGTDPDGVASPGRRVNYNLIPFVRNYEGWGFRAEAGVKLVHSDSF